MILINTTVPYRDMGGTPKTMKTLIKRFVRRLRKPGPHQMKIYDNLIFLEVGEFSQIQKISVLKLEKLKKLRNEVKQ